MWKKISECRPEELPREKAIYLVWRKSEPIPECCICFISIVGDLYWTNINSFSSPVLDDDYFFLVPPLREKS